MMTPSWRRWLKRFSHPFGSDRRPGRSRSRNRPSQPPALERLEDRTLLSSSIPLNSTSWTDIGPAPITGGQVPGGGNVSGRVTGLATDPGNANIIYAATAGGGVWKTTNGGTSWAPLTDNLTDGNGKPIPEFMGAVAVAPSNSQVVYAGTGEANNPFGDSFSGKGVLVSTDGGSTWTLTGQSQLSQLSISRIAVDPLDPNTAYAAVSNSCVNVNATGSTGIYKTTNGGTTWTNVTAANGKDSIDAWSDVVIDPTTTGNSAVLFAAVGNIQGASGNGVYESTNGGATWSLVGNTSPIGTSIGRISLAIAHPSGAANATLYASIASPSTFGLLELERSTSSGAFWTNITANLNGDNYLGGQGFYDNVIEINPSNPNMVFAAGDLLHQGGSAGFKGGGIVESQDGGATWTDGTHHPDINTGTAGNNGPHTDYHALAFDANGRIVVGNDGGIWRLDSNDLTTPNIAWTDLNSNLETIQFTGIALDPTTANIAYGGSQDNGTEKFNDNRQWSRIDFGDGGFVRVDPTNSQVVYHTFFFGATDQFGTPVWMQRSTDGGSTWTNISGGININDSANFYVPYYIDPNNHSRLLLGTDRLYVTNDGGGIGGDWTQLGISPAPGTPINSIAIDPANSSHIFVAAGSQLFVTSNNGASWTTITPSGVTNSITSVTVDPTSNGQKVYVVTDGFTTGSGGHVFQSTNGGTNWTDIGGTTFPNFPSASVLYLSSISTLFVGTDVGVYASNVINGVNTVWNRYGTSLPNVRVTDLEAATFSGTTILAAGTHGRGAFEIQAVAPSADLSVTNTAPAMVTAGSSATYTISLTNKGPSSATGVVLSDTLPTGATLVSMTPGVNNPDHFTQGQSGSTVTETANGSIAANNVDTFVVVVSAASNLASGAPFSDMASVISTSSDPTSADNTSTVTGSIATSADLSVTKIGPANGTVTAGTQATYTITLVNQGPSDAQNVTLTDTLPTGASFVGFNPDINNQDTFLFSEANGVITATASTMVSGDTDIFTAIVNVGSSLANGAPFDNTVTVTSDTNDPTSTDNTSTVDDTVAVVSDLSVTKTGPSSVTAGTDATYTISFTNAGPDPAPNLVLTDTMPSGATLVSMTASPSNPDTFIQVVSGNVLTETAKAAVASGSTDSFILVLSAPLTLPDGTDFSDTAAVSSTGSVDPTPGDDSSTVTGTVIQPADLSVTKVGPSLVTAGTNATYTITLANKGPFAAQSLVLSDTMPLGALLQSVTPDVTNPDSFTQSTLGNTFTETATAPVASGNQDVFVVVIRAPSSMSAGADFSDTASVTSNNTDLNPNDNSSSVNGSIVTSADLSLTKVGPANVTAGTTATYTITLTNSGPSDAQSVQLTDTLPAGGTFISITPGATNPDSFSFVQSGNTLTSTASAAVAANNTDTFVLLVAAPSSLASGADFSDTLSVSSSTSDPTSIDNSSTVTGSIVTSADLSVTKTGPANVTAGTRATYTITVANNGPSDAQNVTLTDTLPSTAFLISFQAVTNPDGFTFSRTGNVVTESTATMAANHVDVFRAIVSASSGLPNGSDFSDTAVVSSNTTDPTAGDNVSTLSGTIVASADLSVTKTGPAVVTAGDTATYSIAMVNGGPSDAQNVVLSDTLPAGATLVSITPGGSNADQFTLNQSGNTITETANAAVIAGHRDTFVLVVKAASNLTAGSPFSDTASVQSTTSDPTSMDNSSTVSGSIVTSADLSVTKTGPSLVTAGTTASYTITLANNGPSDAQNVQLTDTLPTGSILLGVQASANNPDSFTRSQSGNIVTETANAAVTAGNVDVFTVLVAAPSSLANGAAFSDTASVSSTTNDPNSTNSSSTVTGSIVAVADLSVTKTGPATVTAGDSATYTITVANDGPSDAQNVVLSDTMPTGGAVVSFTPALTNPDSFTLNLSGNPLTASIITLAAGHSDVFTVVLSASASLLYGSSFSDVASISSSTTDNISGNNVSTVASTVVTEAELSVTKTGPAIVTAGMRATYTISLTNNGPSTAASVVLSDTLPSGATLVSITPAGTNLDTFVQGQSGSVVTESANSVGNGHTDVFTLVVASSSQLSDGDPFNDTASVTTASVDPISSDNTSTVTGTIITSADLSVSKTGPATVTAGTSITYTITLTNNGPSDAQNVQLTDTLPSGARFVSLSHGAGNADAFNLSVSGNTITQTATRVGGGNTDTFIVVVAADSNLPTGADFSDTAAVTTTTTDPNLNNNFFSLPGIITTAADLSVSMTGPTSVTAGTNATYTITLTNNGPSDAQQVTLTDVPPAIVVTFTPSANNPDTFSPANPDTFSPALNLPPSRILNQFATSVGAGNTDTFVLVVHVPSSLAQGATINDRASVTSGTTDPVSTDNSFTFSSSVVTSADLSVAKTGPVTVAAGSRATYTLTLTNFGFSDAQNVVLSDALPVGAVLLSVTPGVGNRDTFTQGFAGNKLTESTTTVTAGDTDTFVLVVATPSNLPAGTNFSDTVSVISTTADPLHINNSFTLAGTIVDIADLALSQSGPATAAEGDLLTYTLSVVNTGPSDAQNVVLVDTLPANLALVAANPSQGTLTQAGGAVTFTLGNLASGHTATATVVAQAREDGPTAVTASVISNTPDPSGYNNSAATITNVLEGALGLSVFDQNATEFTALGPVTVASFTHAGALEPGTNFSATINWGDGTTSAGTVVPAGATYLVQGTHSYGPDGNYAITVTVAEDGVSVSGGATATVGEAALPAGVSSSSLTQSITETLEHAFLQQPSADQVNTLSTILTLAEMALVASMTKNGGDAFSAFLVSEFVVPSEFSFLATSLAQNGTSLDTAVSEMELLFLLQSASANGG